MTAPPDRQFVQFARGRLREDMLVGFRESLRGRIDPGTGQEISEDTLRLVTAPGSRFYAEADALDLDGMAIQRRAEFLAAQVRPDRAGSSYLRLYHGPLWGESPLPASGGSGTVTARGAIGTTVVGSTTVPDEFAVRGDDVLGNRYQVFVGGTVGADGTVRLVMQAIDAGPATNLLADAVVTWRNPPAGLDPTALVLADFSGGALAEQDADFAARIMARIRRKPSGGNAAEMRAWARQSSAAVEDAFVYPCAFHAGSVVVSVVQRRSNVVGPLARIPSIGTLAAATGYLVPPGSPVVPQRAFVLVTGVTSQPNPASVRLALASGSATGWRDFTPWPIFDPTSLNDTAGISFVTSQTSFKILSEPGSLPDGATTLTGAACPHIMIWDDAISRFEPLDVTSIVEAPAGTFAVLLGAAPSKTLQVGDLISPDSGVADLIAQSAERFFDALGPGEVVNLTSDLRSTRAFRHPEPREDWPYRVGATLATSLVEDLGAACADGVLDLLGATQPQTPVDVADGPKMFTLGRFAVYNLPA